MKPICRILLLFTILTVMSAPDLLRAEEIEQAKSIRSMNQMLADGKFVEFHGQWCHPHLQRQLGAEEFADSMKEPFGKAVIQLFAETVKLLDAKAGEDKLIAQPQEEDGEFEFVLVEVKGLAERGDRLWHLELGLHEGKWRLRDVD
ncbi:MAG: hypothetical protein ACI8UO_002535 [Verrucomicrobiales bacterium]|jgi:hypothetical protein